MGPGYQRIGAACVGPSAVGDSGPVPAACALVTGAAPTAGMRLPEPRASLLDVMRKARPAYGDARAARDA